MQSNCIFPGRYAPLTYVTCVCLCETDIDKVIASKDNFFDVCVSVVRTKMDCTVVPQFIR